MALFSPRSRILLYLSLVAAVFIPHPLEISFVMLAIVTASSFRVPFSSLKRGIFPITVFLLFTFVSNVLFQEGRVVYEVFGLDITDEGLVRGGRLTLRLLILIAGAKVLTASTRSEDLVNAMSGLLGPAGRIRFVQEVLYSMSLTLRLLPVIYNEAVELYKNKQSSAGSGLSGRIRISVELLTTLFERSLVKAREMDVDDTSASGSGERGGQDIFWR